MRPVANRRIIAGAAAVAAVGGAALFNRFVVRTEPAADWPLVLSASLVVAIVAAIAAAWPESRGRIAALTTAAALVSLATTAAHAPRAAPRDAAWILVESIALLTLAALVVRWAPPRAAAAAGAGAVAAEVLTSLRITAHAWSPELVGAILNWALTAGAAVALGLYLRALDARRARMVLDARRQQRLELARDLHDYVAHDVTGIVVQAQGAHLVARRDPQVAIDALDRIADAGLRALGSLDRTVRMLGEDAREARRPAGAAEEPAPRTVAPPNHGVEDVFALVGRFAASDHVPVHLHVDIPSGRRIPPDVAGAAYRVVLEALTNVRRHAPTSTRADVSIRLVERTPGPAIEVRVTNESPGPARPPAPLGDAPRGGHGIAGLAATVRDAGGTLEAGALDGSAARGWHVTAVLPLDAGVRA